MKKFAIIIALAFVPYLMSAQDAQAAAEEAAAAVNEAAEGQTPAPKFKDYWTESLKTNVNLGQTSLTNWAAGGDNTLSLAAYIDGNANYKKDEMYWNNRLQLDYGFLYASSKPIFQKNTDRIYLESRWGYQIKDKLYFSTNYDFKSQFAKGWTYATPGADIIDGIKSGATSLDELTKAQQRAAWRDARVGKSNFLSPAYTTLAIGIDWKPKTWFSVSFAPLTGGYVIVADKQFRQAYSMKVNEKKGYCTPDSDMYASLSEEDKAKNDAAIADGSAFKSHRFEFGAQLKVDLKASINEKFTYTTQLMLFEDYLKNHKENPCPRINWDNRIDWKLAKYFALTLTTNLIYDDMVMIKTDKWLANTDTAFRTAHPNGVAALQFKESIAFGFTYTIASKK